MSGRALVTGGAGFIGSHLVDRLLAAGYAVRVLDNLQPRVHPNGVPPYLSSEVQFIRGDVRDRAALTRALEGCEAVLHCAAYQDYMPDFSTFMHTNAVSAALIYEILVERGWAVRKVVIASSQAVYGEGQYQCGEHGFFQPVARSPERLARGDWDVRCPACGQVATPLPLDERYANPYNAYGLSKWAEEQVALRLGYLHRIPTVALRYSITQGPRQSLYNSYSGLLRISCLRLLHNQPPLIYENGLQQRDYTHVADAVEANMVVLARAEADYEIFNVGSGHATTVREYASLLAEKLGKTLEPLIPGEYRVGDNRHSVSSIEKLRRLGWAPRLGLGEIIDDYLAWVRSVGDLRRHFLEADRVMRQMGVVRHVTG